MTCYRDMMQRLARPGTVLLLLLLFLGVYTLLNYTHLPMSIPALQAASQGKTILNVLPHYSADQAYEHIAAYSPVAIDIYYRIIVIDLVALIPLYVLFLSAALLHAGGVLFRNRAPSLSSGLTWLPWLAALLNLLEDGVIVTLIKAYPERYDTLATVAGYLTSSKSLLLTAALLLLMVFYLLIAISRTVYWAGLRNCRV